MEIFGGNMVELYNTGVFLINGKEIIVDNDNDAASKLSQKGISVSKEQAKEGTFLTVSLNLITRAAITETLP